MKTNNTQFKKKLNEARKYYISRNKRVFNGDYSVLWKTWVLWKQCKSKILEQFLTTMWDENRKGLKRIIEFGKNQETKMTDVDSKTQCKIETLQVCIDERFEREQHYITVFQTIIVPEVIKEIGESKYKKIKY